MNLFRRALANASKTQQVNEAMTKHESKVWAAMESLSQAIRALFEYADTPGISKEAKDTAKALANDLANRYDQIQMSADKNIGKLRTLK